VERSGRERTRGGGGGFRTIPRTQPRGSMPLPVRSFPVTSFPVTTFPVTAFPVTPFPVTSFPVTLFSVTLFLVMPSPLPWRHSPPTLPLRGSTTVSSCSADPLSRSSRVRIRPLYLLTLFCAGTDQDLIPAGHHLTRSN